MKNKLSEIINEIKCDKKLLLIVFIGVVGILLLLLSEVLPADESDEKEDDVNVNRSVYEYEIEMEKRLEELLNDVEGAGRVSVMLLLDSGDESVYATENKSGINSDEKSYVLVENNGEDNGLLLKVSQPMTRGVGVVCEGADIPKVRQEITGLLTAVLGVSANRVNIAKMKPNNGG